MAIQSYHLLSQKGVSRLFLPVFSIAKLQVGYWVTFVLQAQDSRHAESRVWRSRDEVEIGQALLPQAWM